MSLDAAIAAARADQLGATDAIATRDRIAESLRRRGAAQRALLTAATVLGVLLVGSTAYAWYSGWLPAQVRAWRGEEQAAPAAAAPAAAHPRSVGSSDLPRDRWDPPITPPIGGILRSPEPAATPPPAKAAPRHRRVAAAASPLPAPVVEAPPAASPELAAYRAAHDAHFGGAGAGAALAAWDAYLDGYPDGSFAPEARYNRALCLVRLERWSAAAAALAPFADGTEGGYRQREAAALRAKLAGRE